jgi:hypothetical protein
VRESFASLVVSCAEAIIKVRILVFTLLNLEIFMHVDPNLQFASIIVTSTL